MQACHKCKSQNADGAKFCGACGARLVVNKPMPKQKQNYEVVLGLAIAFGVSTVLLIAFASYLLSHPSVETRTVTVTRIVTQTPRRIIGYVGNERLSRNTEDKINEWLTAYPPSNAIYYVATQVTIKTSSTYVALSGIESKNLSLKDDQYIKITTMKTFKTIWEGVLMINNSSGTIRLSE